MLTRLEANTVEKPWGRTDVPAHFGALPGQRIGEVWFQRAVNGSADALLVKYLFTSEKLSVQVHPSDAAAKAASQPRGKDEAWVILDADEGATLGIGLKGSPSSDALRKAAEDGAIIDMLDWRTVAKGDVYYSPAGTVHSIGAGLTLLEVQQNSDITYRLYDFGRPRELHVDAGIAAATTGASITKSSERSVGPGRSIIAQGSKFTLERWNERSSTIEADPERPLWLIPLHGEVTADGTRLEPGSVWIADTPLFLKVGASARLFVAYEGSEIRAAS